MWIFATIFIISLLAFILFIYLEAKNASLECNNCQYLIPTYLKGKCPNCGFEHDIYNNYAD